MKHLTGYLGAAALVSALALSAAPAHAKNDITNFRIKNCAQERMFVCSFDKTDNLMQVPYKSGGLQPGDRKEFGCASLNRCKVIVGVSKKKSASIIPRDIKAPVQGASFAVGLVTGGMLLIAGGVAALEVKDGWSDGEVCRQVRKAAEKAGVKKPKIYLRDGNNYQVTEAYATDENGNPYVNDDGTAVFAYSVEKGGDNCPTPLNPQLGGN